MHIFPESWNTIGRWLIIISVGIIILTIIISFLGVFIRRRRLLRSGMVDVDRMSGTEFEHFLGLVFRQYGYQIEHTGKSGDYGADLIIKKDQSRTVIQAKRYTKNVGVKAIQEAVAAKKVYHCQGAIVITNSHYTKQAQVLAKANEVVLWDRERLLKVMLMIKNQPTNQS